MKPPSPRPRPAVLWWTCWTLFTLFTLLPGPDRSPFSGVPLSAKGMLLFALLLILGVATGMYRATRKVHAGVIGGFVLLIVLKLVLATMLVNNGWTGEYFSRTRTNQKTFNELTRAYFQDGLTARPYRVDRAIAYDRVSFGLSYLNEFPPTNRDWSYYDRSNGQPLIVRWTGWLDLPSARAIRTNVSANGTLVMRVDGAEVFRARNPNAAAVATHELPAGIHKIEVVYLKPPNVDPAVTVGDIGRVSATRATAASLDRSQLASRAIDVLGILGLLLLVVAFRQAYGRFSVFFLEELWLRPDRVAAIVFFAFFLFLGLRQVIPNRHATMQLAVGDDPIAYEGSARAILRNGPLMLDDQGKGTAYYFYPFYPYVLSVAHILWGDDSSAMLMLNYVCAASLILLMWALLRRRLRYGSTMLVLLLFTIFVKSHVLNWAWAPYTDNLFAPLTLATIIVTVIAFERKSLKWMFAVGVLTAIAAATRPSMLLHLPIMALAPLLFRDLGPLRARMRASVAFVVGFFAGVAPFTIRNWVVSHKFVLLVASFIMIPYFMIAPEDKRPSFVVNGQIPTATQSIGQGIDLIVHNPVKIAWTETRKVLFTFGLTKFGPKDIFTPNHFLIFPVLFFLALWAGRIDRPVAAALLTFGASHLAAMVVGAPWTYGYKTILPFHIAAIAGAAFLLPRRGEKHAEVMALEHRPPGPQRRPTVSVILPTYNEKDSIRQCILDFFATGVVTEVLVINNNAAKGTSEEVAGTGAIEIFETRQGYGSAVQRGLREAKGEWIVVCEPDGTFLAGDIHKLLAYADDFDVVYGSRTAQQMVWRGANMGTFLRWGNWVVAKYLEFLYNATSLTDVGCTLRLIRRDAAAAILPQFRITGSQFGPEMMIVSLRAGFRVIQVPVNYLPRVGVSSVTGDPAKAFRLGMQMLWLITERRFEHLFRSDSSSTQSEPIANGVRLHD